jgi:hypothetical protein
MDAWRAESRYVSRTSRRDLRTADLVRNAWRTRAVRALPLRVCPSKAPRPVPSWRPGTFVWPEGSTKLVLVGGVGSRTGDAERSFAGLIRFLAERGGYDPRRDVLEATYAGVEVDGEWQPRPYVPADSRRPLLDSAEAVANSLDWYRARLPETTRLCVLGYSLGGVVALDGATLAIVRDRVGWQGRLASVLTFAAPLRGSSAGAIVSWAWLVTAEPDGLGEAGRDLVLRWEDPEEQERVTRRAAFVRAAGARLLTLTDPDDAVVRPEEALLPAPGESSDDLLVATDRVRPGSMGHGAVLDEPATWRRVFSVLGLQKRVARVAPGQRDAIEQELQAIKARLRAEGRLK